jgi:hypothetical protein
MSLYIHHVPGRLRVRTQAFRCQPSRIEQAARQLRAAEGVRGVAVNAAAGSITVQYDPDLCTHKALLAVLEDLGCVGARRLSSSQGGEVAGLFGKALVGALAQTLAQRSVQTLVGVLR